MPVERGGRAEAASVDRSLMSSSWVVQSGGRGRSSWKHSWAARALSSASLPPPRLLAFFAIVVFFLSVSSYVDYKAMERRAEIGARVFAAPLALMAAFLLFAALRWQTRRRHSWTTLGAQRRGVLPQPSSSSGGSSPWVVALAVAVLLVMVSFQSSVHSMWFRPLWSSDNYS